MRLVAGSAAAAPDVILRLLFALFSLTILGALLYMQQSEGDRGELGAGEPVVGEPGYAAIHAELIETGADGHPLYRLDADRIEQPQPQGTILLSAPRLEYEPEQAGNHWILTARHGQLPQDARSADLDGDVHAVGTPSSSNAPMRIDTQQLHLDMTQQLATTSAPVTVDWAGNILHGRGMRADLKRDRLQLAQDVHGVVSR